MSHSDYVLHLHRRLQTLVVEQIPNTGKYYSAAP